MTKKTVKIISKVISPNHYIETVLTEKGITELLVSNQGQESYVSSYSFNDVTYTSNKSIKSLIGNKVILLPENIKSYSSKEKLISDIQGYIHNYLDLDLDQEIIATYYVLLSWVQDAFNQVPYLRKTGDYGTGKTRFLKTLGSISYKGIFASGASTISPIFHLLDTVQGTLVLDEADFSDSDSKNQVTKILNNGFTQGFPVLRSMIGEAGDYLPRSFRVFGCKILATRSFFKDSALESRFITFHSSLNPLRVDIPVTLPIKFDREARDIRNKLLLFRLENYEKYRNTNFKINSELEPRIKQILLPLFALMKDDSEATDALFRYANSLQDEINQDRSSQTEARILTVIKNLWEQDDVITIKAITNQFLISYSTEYSRKISYRWVGNIVRRVLGLKTHKTNGLYTLKKSEGRRLSNLYKRFNV